MYILKNKKCCDVKWLGNISDSALFLDHKTNKQIRADDVTVQINENIYIF